MENPYQSPATTEADDEGTQSLRPDGTRNATQGNRFVNYLIDYVVTSILSYAGGFALGAALVDSVDEQQLAILGGILGFAIYIFYYVVLEIACGKTLGKMATRTRVVDADGNPPSAGQILGRTLARLIPFEPFSYLFGDTTRGWHDGLSKTYVVKD
ncbi:MAG: RDD family protein [Planctomycetota bacterium]